MSYELSFMVNINWSWDWLASAVLNLKWRTDSLHLDSIDLFVGQRRGFVYMLGVCSGGDVSVAVGGEASDKKWLKTNIE